MLHWLDCELFKLNFNVWIQCIYSQQDFFYNNARHRPPPCVLSRSLLQLLYIPLCNRVLGQQPLTEVLQDAARTFIAPPALTGGLGLVVGSQQYAQVQECIDQLFQQCVRPMGSLIQIAGHNLARQRDKLGHILQDLAALQEEVILYHLQYL